MTSPQIDITPENAAWRFLSFAVHQPVTATPDIFFDEHGPGG